MSFITAFIFLISRFYYVWWEKVHNDGEGGRSCPSLEEYFWKYMQYTYIWPGSVWDTFELCSSSVNEKVWKNLVLDSVDFIPPSGPRTKLSPTVSCKAAAHHFTTNVEKHGLGSCSSCWSPIAPVGDLQLLLGSYKTCWNVVPAASGEGIAPRILTQAPIEHHPASKTRFSPENWELMVVGFSGPCSLAGSVANRDQTFSSFIGAFLPPSPIHT